MLRAVQMALTDSESRYDDGEEEEEGGGKGGTELEGEQAAREVRNWL